MKPLKTKTVAIIGNRKVATPSGKEDLNLENVVRTELSRVISELYREGKTIFMNGLSEGFDLLCAELVIELRDKHPEVKLIAVIPYMGQELMYSNVDKFCYGKIIEASDSQVLIWEDGYSTFAYRKRNEYMLSRATTIVAYSDGSEELTSASIAREEESNKRVINLYETLCSYFENNHPSKDILQSYSDSPSFTFDCKGVIFEGSRQRFEVNYSQINGIEEDGSFLKFYLSNSMFVYSSLISDFYMLEYVNSQIRN